MKIFLPFQSHGNRFMGVTTFARKFKSGMEAAGHEVFFEYQEEYDVLFLIVQAPFKYLWEAKRRKKKIVQRLDGVFYWSVVGWKFPLLNLKAAIIRHFFADFTIYQSHYSRLSVNTFLGKKPGEKSALIYNGVDLDLFHPEGERKIERAHPEEKIFFTASAFRRPDQILPILEALHVYRRKYGDNFKCYIAGTFAPALQHIPKQYAHFKNVFFLGKIENDALSAYERSADVFLFTHYNPPCPNNVLEALACGLPICGIADGAMLELVEERKNARLLPVTGTAFWKPREYDVEKFADNLFALTHEQAAYAQESRRIAVGRFSLPQMIARYEEVFNQLKS